MRISLLTANGLLLIYWMSRVMLFVYWSYRMVYIALVKLTDTALFEFVFICGCYVCMEKTMGRQAAIGN